MSLSDDIRKAKLKAKLHFDGLMQSLAKSIETDKTVVKNGINIELANESTAKGGSEIELVGRGTYKDEKELKEAKEAFEKFIMSLSEDDVKEMMTKYGNL